MEDGHNGVQQVIKSVQVFQRIQYLPISDMREEMILFCAIFFPHLLPSNVLFQEAVGSIRGEVF